jgi:hypothetical protein
MTASPQFRPMSIGDLFDTAFRLYRMRFWRLIAIAALAAVPIAALSSLLWSRLAGSPTGIFGMFGFYAASFVIDAILSLTIENLQVGALVGATSRAYLGQPVTILGAYRFGVGRYFALVVASLVPFLIKSLTRPLGSLLGFFWLGSPRLFLAGSAPVAQSGYDFVPLLLFCAAAFLVFQLAVLLLYAYFLLLPQAIVLEGRGPLAGLRRSWQLVRGSARRALAIVVATEILSFLISSVPQWLLMMLSFRLSGFGFPLVGLVFGLVALAGQLLIQPLLFAIFTVFYYDLRVRKEAFDIELMAERLAAAPTVLL